MGDLGEQGSSEGIVEIYFTAVKTRRYSLIHILVFVVLQGGDWSLCLQKVCEFSTVEEFWRNWSFIPRPRLVIAANFNSCFWVVSH